MAIGLTWSSRGAWVLTSALLLGGACRGQSSAGGFEDDLDTGEASPPDLPQSECDPRYQGHCEDGEKCSYVADTPYGPLDRCVPILGEGRAGAPCFRSGDSDTCAEHHVCWALDGDGKGVCVEYCSPALECDDPLMTCTGSNDDLLALCMPKCDPLLQDCAEGWACYVDDYQRWACDRDQSGALGAHGDPCACLNCCDPGLICMAGAYVDGEGCGSADAPSCCGSVCMLDQGQPVEGVCPSEAERCEPFYSGLLMMGYDQIGVCRL